MRRKKRTPAPRCPYCNRLSVLRKATYIYQNETKEEYLYVCSGYPYCDSYVGVHKGTTHPKGTLANGNLRNKRIQAHKYFDAIWKRHIFSRDNAYRWMSDILGLNLSQAHIGQFSDYQLDYLIDACKKVLCNNNISC